jgi:hypothetical protein
VKMIVTFFFFFVSNALRRRGRQLLKRSLRAVRPAASKPKGSKPAFCIFFNRFGYCKKGAACPFVHDASKVAVCKAFLRGVCSGQGCLLSHQAKKKKKKKKKNERKGKKRK